MPELGQTYVELRKLMEPYAESLDVKRDDDIQLYLDTRHIQKNKKPLFFGAVQVKKSYVSYHLMPIYIDPALLDGISDALRAKMQGKSCFNFKQTDPPLFAELSQLTQRCFESYRSQGFFAD